MLMQRSGIHGRQARRETGGAETPGKRDTIEDTEKKGQAGKTKQERDRVWRGTRPPGLKEAGQVIIYGRWAMF